MNGNFVPLVYILLPGKSDDIYRLCFTKLIDMCESRNLTFSPNIIHVDFEERVMVVVRQLFPLAELKCCRFHLAQAWWRKIQNLGFSKNYKDCSSDIGKWLNRSFWLAFLPNAEVEDASVGDIMQDAPSESRCSKLADCLTENYVTNESKFPPVLWAEQPSD
jgi:hypothetical protein